MAITRICSIPDCGKPHKGRGFCGTHLLRLRTHGDPLFVMPKEMRQKPGKKGPTKFKVEPDWLRAEYYEKRRPVGEIAAEIGCSREHLNWLVDSYDIPRRDGRAGAKHIAARVVFDLDRAKWLYEIDRMACSDIGTLMGCSGDVVRRRLRAAGIRIRHHNDTKRGAKAKNRVKVDEKSIIRLFQQARQSVATVSETLGLKRGIVRRVLHEHRVPMKRISEVRDNAGEKNPNWRRDLTPEDRARRRDMHKQALWRVKVYERDGYTCQRCFDGEGGNLNAHHIEAHCENEATRWNLDNGVTLCGDYHRGFHRRYGLRGFGRNHLDEWLGSSGCIERLRLTSAA